MKQGTSPHYRKPPVLKLKLL